MTISLNFEMFTEKILLSTYRSCYSLEGTPVCTKLTRHSQARSAGFRILRFYSSVMWACFLHVSFLILTIRLCQWKANFSFWGLEEEGSEKRDFWVFCSGERSPCKSHTPVGMGNKNRHHLEKGKELSTSTLLPFKLCRQIADAIKNIRIIIKL